MQIIGSSLNVVSKEIGLKSSVMNVGDLVISGINAQGNRQSDPMLMVLDVHSRVLLFCYCCHLMQLI